MRLHDDEQDSSASRALSLIKVQHTRVITQLIIQFGISPARAYELALNRKDYAVLQLEAWPFREAKPRNPAEWIIQAIENNYDLPTSYLRHQEEQRFKAKRAADTVQRKRCRLCDENGFRHVRNAKYPNGAMRQCSHNAEIEQDYPPFTLPTPNVGTALTLKTRL